MYQSHSIISMDVTIPAKTYSGVVTETTIAIEAIIIEKACKSAIDIAPIESPLTKEQLVANKHFIRSIAAATTFCHYSPEHSEIVKPLWVGHVIIDIIPQDNALTWDPADLETAIAVILVILNTDGQFVPERGRSLYSSRIHVDGRLWDGEYDTLAQLMNEVYFDPEFSYESAFEY